MQSNRSVGVRQAESTEDQDDPHQQNKLYPVELSTDEDEGEFTASSLPTVEEARSSMINPNDASILPKKRPWRLYSIIASIVVAMALIIGLSVAFASEKGKKSNESSSVNDASSSDQFDAVVDYLAVRGISPAHTFRDPESPQSRAAQWIANEDALGLDVPQEDDENDPVHYRFVFRYVMAVLFYYWGGITEWQDPLSFLNSQDVCQWRASYTINPNTPNQQQFFKGVSCAEDGTPIMIDLESNQLVGSGIPDEIAHLTSLEGLDLRGNFLSGSLPDTICKLRGITTLQLQYNNFTGTIPSCLADIPNLGSLVLHDNSFTGPLPSSLAQLTSLNYLYVNDNYLSGNPVNTLNALSNLRDLFISNNEFTGTIDNSFLENHVNLMYLDMSHNNFTSTVFPSQLLELPALEVLDFSKNRFEGAFPESISSNTVLTLFSMYGNRISGSIPSSISNIQFLEHLDVSRNRLTGVIPSEIGDLQFLTKLYLSENPFTPGPFPSAIQNLFGLLELSMRNTNLQGALPSSLNSTDLLILDLGSNMLTGMIPTSFGSFPSLFFLLLNNNSGITGQLPTSFENLWSVHGFYLDGTNLTGNFDDIFCNLDYPDDENERIVFADCGTQSQVTCTCDCQCCDGDLSQGCSYPTLENIDLQFEDGFDRVSFPDYEDNYDFRLL